VKPSERADPDLDGSRFRAGVEQFNRGEFWRAHESWEAVWLASRGERRQFLQGLIQVAAACYHIERDNRGGALRLLTAALGRLDALDAAYGGIDLSSLRDQARALPGATKDTFVAPKIASSRSSG